jgi:ABC-type glycerol-3-phosphate transport system substrate-binding protein
MYYIRDRNKLKNNLWHLIGFIVFLALLAACTNIPSETSFTGTTLPQHLITPTPGGAPTPLPTPTLPLPRFDDVADNLNGTQIEFWYVWDRYGIDPYKEMVVQFNALNDYDIAVTAINQGGYGDLAREMDSAFSYDEMPDIAMAYNYQYLAWEALGDVTVDLTPYLTDVVFGFDEDAIADFYPVFWEHDLIGDHRYGLPAQRSGTLLFYNTTWAEELGFDSLPQTPDEFKQQACAAAADNGDGTGGWFINTSTAGMTSWLYAFDGEIESGAAGYNFNTAEVAAAFDFLYDLSLQTPSCAWYPGHLYPNDEFASRRGLFYTSSVVGIPYQIDAFEAAGNNDTWEPIPYPGVNDDPVITVYGPSFLMVKSSPEEQLASWVFLQYLLEPDNQALVVEATGGFPVGKSAVGLLDGTEIANAQWLAAVELLEHGRFEPRFSSWRTVRAALRDAGEMLFIGGFDPTKVSELLDQLQATAEELHAEAGGN